MICYNKFFETAINSLKQEGIYRVFADLIRLTGKAPYALWHDNNDTKEVVVWCSNDYLDMSHHPEVIRAMTEGAKAYGVGSGGTRNISGTCHVHVQLEQVVAQLHGKERGLIFSSGYAANEATLSTLANGLPNCSVLSDEKNHASIIQGIKHSRAEKIIFAHNNLEDLHHKLKEIPLGRPKLIAFTSVYSMDGDFAPIPQICKLAEQFNAITFLDEVHAVGIYGKQGAGLASQMKVSQNVDIIQGNFAKAYGVVGGYISSKKEIVDYVRSFANGFIFTTSLPPAIADAALKSIKILQNCSKLKESLWQNVYYLKEQLSKTNVNFHNNQSHIVPVIVGDPIRCKQLCDILRNNYGIYVQPINYPTVPKGQERIRLTVTPAHTREMIDDLVRALSYSWRELCLQLAA